MVCWENYKELFLQWRWNTILLVEQFELRKLAIKTVPQRQNPFNSDLQESLCFQREKQGSEDFLARWAWELWAQPSPASVSALHRGHSSRRLQEQHSCEFPGFLTGLAKILRLALIQVVFFPFALMFTLDFSACWETKKSKISETP